MNSIFGTDHIIYVPENEPFRYMDLYHWRRMEWDVHLMRARLRQSVIELSRQRCKDSMKEYFKTPEGLEDQAKTRALVDSFWRDIRSRTECPEPPLLDSQWPMDKAAPQKLTFWVRISDAPAESFFEEDYDSTPLLSSSSSDPFSPAADSSASPAESGAAPGRKAIPVYGNLTLKSLGDAEIALPHEGPEAGFLLDFDPENSFRMETLDPRRPLPICQEFCGYRGASNRGYAANYTIEGKIASENLGCIPLHSFGHSAYATLYFYMKTIIQYDLVVRIRERRLEQAIHKLKAMGYSIYAEGASFKIWERPSGASSHASGTGESAGGMDILHLYVGIPGKEAEGARFMRPFVLAICQGGSYAPEKRSKLIAELAAKPE